MPISFLLSTKHDCRSQKQENDFRGKASVNERDEEKKDRKKERKNEEGVQCFGTGFTDQVFFCHRERFVGLNQLGKKKILSHVGFTRNGQS